MPKKAIKDGHDWSEGEVFKALESIYGDPERWTVVKQVPDATSFDKKRTCDAMVFSCWKSEGIAVHGFEIKVARGDWLRELQQPEKSFEFRQRSNYWWIAAPEGIVNLEELPSEWGLRTVAKTADGFSSKIRRQPTYYADANWKVSFVVALARACWRLSPERLANADLIKQTYDQGYEAGKIAAERDGLDYKVRNEVAECRRILAEFKDLSGFELHEWLVKDYAKAVRAFMKLQEVKRDLKYPIESIERILKEVKELSKQV